MASIEKIAALVDSLPVSPDKIAVLGDLKIALSAVNPSDLSEVAPNVSFDIIFECLDPENSAEQLTVCCDVLGRLLGAMEPTSLLDQFHSELIQGFSHPYEEVRHFSVLQTLRAVERSVQQVAAHEDILIQLVELLADVSMQVEKDAAKVLIKLGSTLEGLEALFRPAVLNHFKSTMQLGDVTRYRVYEVIVSIASWSSESIEYCEKSGLFRTLVNEVQSDDILVQLNSLELLKDLALSQHGMLYLEQQGVINRLETMLGAIENNAFSELLFPGLVKFFGNVAYMHPEEISSHFQSFINTVFNLLDHDNVSLGVIAIETLGFIGSKPEGKLALNKQGNQMDVALKKMGQITREAALEARVKTMTAVASMLTLLVPDQTSELLSLTEFWFGKLFPNPLEQLMTLAQQPFNDLRLAVLDTFTAIACQPWGQHTFNNHPGFNEYVLDRSTEKSKEGKEGKYLVVKTLVESPTAMNIFERPYYVRLKEFLMEGPFYIRTESVVAMEGAS